MNSIYLYCESGCRENKRPCFSRGGAEEYGSQAVYRPADGDDANRGVRLSERLDPPDLVIQDELHLISGPLGSMAGLYESVIDELCTRDGLRPKIVASTATVRRASEQMQALFGRPKSSIFPAPGPNRRDSFFAVTVPADEVPGRL